MLWCSYRICMQRRLWRRGIVGVDIMPCEYFINNQCHLILEWQPRRYITEAFCRDICRGRFGGDKEKLIAWAKDKAKKQSARPKPELTELQKRGQERNRICNACNHTGYCMFKKDRACKRNRDWAFCKENKWPKQMKTWLSARWKPFSGIIKNLLNWF